MPTKSDVVGGVIDTIPTYRTPLSALRMHSAMSGYHWLSHSTMCATAAVRQCTDTENYSLPAQSTLRMAGITAV